MCSSDLRGLYAVGVITTVTPIERNRVNLTFNVSEGQPSRISEIQIVGNKAFSQSTLLDQFDQDTGGWLSWYTKSNLYTRVKLNADLEALKSTCDRLRRWEFMFQLAPLRLVGATGSPVIASILATMAAAVACEHDGNTPVTPEQVLHKLAVVEKRIQYA